MDNLLEEIIGLENVKDEYVVSAFSRSRCMKLEKIAKSTV